MPRLSAVLCKFDLLNHYHLGYILLFSYLSIPINFAKTLCFVCSVSIGYGVWTSVVLLLTVICVSYSKLLDTLCRKSLALLLLIFTGVILTTALFVRQFTSTFVIGSLVYVLIVWLEAALLVWVSEITVYKNVFIAMRGVHIIASNQILDTFGINFWTDAAFVGLIVVIGLGMGYALIFIPGSPAYHLELKEYTQAKQEMGKLCVMHDESYGFSAGVTRDSKCKKTQIKEIDRILMLLMICLSLTCHTSYLSNQLAPPDPSLRGVGQTNPPATTPDDRKLITALQIVLTLVQGLVITLIRTNEFKYVLKGLMAFHFMIIIAQITLKIMPDEVPDYNIVYDVLKMFGLLVKNVLTQTMLYMTVRKAPVTVKHSLVSLIIAFLSFGDDVQIMMPDSLVLLSNSLFLTVIVIPKLSDFDGMKAKYYYRYFS